MKKILVVSALLLSVFCAALNAQPVSVAQHVATDSNPGWRLAVQAWTFHNFTLFETIEKASAAGVDWIELYPGQTVGGEYPDAKFGPGMDEELQGVIKFELKAAGLRLVNMGVTGMPEDQEGMREVFEFVKAMGIETLIVEPEEKLLDPIEKLAVEYNQRVAIHNHPEPSRYWDPAYVLENLEGRSELMGAAGDTGHWLRSGINPVEAIKLLGNRLLTIHLKDLNEAGNKEAHDVVWGAGETNLPAVFETLKEMGYEGVFSIEYEYNWDNSLPEVKQCVRYFQETTAELFPGGWDYVFDADLTNAVMNEGAWEYEPGLLTVVGEGDIWSEERYGNFVLDLEFKLAKETNSGVFVRTGSLENWLHTAIEVQILDSKNLDPGAKHSCGAIFDVLAPEQQMVREVGEWNHYTITCLDNMIYVVFNGEQVIAMDLDDWTEAHKNPDGTKNKFNTAYKDMPREGHLGLQYHGHPVWFRHIRIKEL